MNRSKYNKEDWKIVKIAQNIVKKDILCKIDKKDIVKGGKNC
jgi:hypothetical protein